MVELAAGETVGFKYELDIPSSDNFSAVVYRKDGILARTLHNMIWSARNMALNRTEELGQTVLEHFAVAGEVKPNK